MNRRFFHSRSILPPVEMEPPRQNAFRPAPQPPQTRSILSNYRNNRAQRQHPQQTIERPEPLSQKPCRFCHNLVPTNTYNEHLTFCPVKAEVQQQVSNPEDQERMMEVESPQRSRVEPIVAPSPQEENPNISNNTESRETHPPSQEVPALEGSEGLGSQPMRPEVQTMPIFHPFPGQELQDQNQPGQPINQPGPPETTGAAFRMRAIDSILHRLEENGGQGNGMERRGILGLLGMLAGLHGARATHFGEFLSMINRERGLDREVMESLPVVVYTEERFKNVEEESKKCSICLDCYEDQQEVKFLWCMHRFHKDCVDQWLDKHTNCPFCKKDYVEALRNQGES